METITTHTDPTGNVNFDSEAFATIEKREVRPDPVPITAARSMLRDMIKYGKVRNQEYTRSLYILYRIHEKHHRKTKKSCYDTFFDSNQSIIIQSTDMHEPFGWLTNAEQELTRANILEYPAKSYEYLILTEVGQDICTRIMIRLYQEQEFCKDYTWELAYVYFKDNYQLFLCDLRSIPPWINTMFTNPSSAVSLTSPKSLGIFTDHEKYSQSIRNLPESIAQMNREEFRRIVPSLHNAFVIFENFKQAYLQLLANSPQYQDKKKEVLHNVWLSFSESQCRTLRLLYDTFHGITYS